MSVDGKGYGYGYKDPEVLSIMALFERLPQYTTP